MFLRRAEQVVEESDIQLQDFNEFNHSAISHIEFAVKIEGSRIRFAAVFSDLAIINVTGQLCTVLIFLVFWLERSNANSILFRQEESFDDNRLHHSGPVAVAFFQAFLKVESAERADVAVDLDAVLLIGVASFIQAGSDFFSIGVWNKLQRFTMHRVPGDAAVVLFPPERIEGSFGLAGIAFQPTLQQSGDGTLGTPYRSVKQ